MSLLDGLKNAQAESQARGEVKLEPVATPAKCCPDAPQTSRPGVMETLKAIKDTGLNLLEFALTPKVDTKEYERRKRICMGCQARDSEGHRMFRDGLAPTCGKPWLQQIKRDESKDGCGCDLLTKWQGSTQHCPLGHW